MKRIRNAVSLIIVFLLTACGKKSVFFSSKVESLSYYQDANIYNKKYYLLPNDIFSNKEISLSKRSFIFFYKDLLTIWNKNDSQLPEYKDYNYLINIYYFKLIDGKIFYGGFGSASAPKTPILLNKTEDLNDETVASFYREVPFSTVYFADLYYESGENLIFAYVNNKQYVLYATVEAATELGVVFVD